MKLFEKIKNVLFEEEEIEVPVTPKETPKKEEKKEIKQVERPIKQGETEDVIVREIPKIQQHQEKKIVPKDEIDDDIDSDFIERDIFNPKKTFEFPVFDESDFEDTKRFTRGNSKLSDKDKKLNFGRFEDIKIEKKEDSKSFTPSPVISPVYGILDQNYKKEDIKSKFDKPLSGKNKALSIDAVRKKAYGTLEDDIESILPDMEKQVEEELIEDDIDVTSPKKTIDDLLLDSIDETITVGDMEEILEEQQEEVIEEELEEDKTMNVLDELESRIENKTIDKNKLENETLENDLFNLIDSMYDTREDGE